MGDFMKVYLIFELLQEDQHYKVVLRKNNIFLTKHDAFEALKEIGDSASVSEYNLARSWNLKQALEEEDDGNCK